MSWDGFNRIMEYFMVALVLLGLWALKRRAGRKRDAQTQDVAAREAVLARFPGASAHIPGESAEQNAQILRLMREGRMTARVSAFAEYSDKAPMPAPGHMDVALDWQGRPALATRTMAVERLRYDQMDEARIPPQGAFADLDAWRAFYRAYLTRLGGFSPEAELVLEWFELAEDFGEK